MSSDPLSLTVVTLGRPSPGQDEQWRRQPEVDRIVRFRAASDSGLRFGRRALGLGLDSFVVALCALRHGRETTFLATNPWIGVWLKLLGCRSVVVTGIYSEAGSRSWRVLRRALGASPVIANVAVEADAWSADGGRVALVRYGRRFGYPLRTEGRPGVLRVFVGGTSDRDWALVHQLSSEVRSSETPVELTLALGSTRSVWRNDVSSSIESHPRCDQEAFGTLIAGSDVVFLPLTKGQRAAGHMVAIGALESGVPVLTSPSIGMQGYVDGEFVCEAEPGAPLLPQLARRAELFEGAGSARVRDHWVENYSPEINIRRVITQAIELLAATASAPPQKSVQA